MKMIKLKTGLTETDCLRICQGITTLKNCWENNYLNNEDRFQLDWLWETFARCHELRKEGHKIKLIVE